MKRRSNHNYRFYINYLLISLISKDLMASTVINYICENLRNLREINTIMNKNDIKTIVKEKYGRIAAQSVTESNQRSEERRVGKECW